MHELRRILPETFSEDKIDWDKLKVVLGDHIDSRIEKFGFSWAGKSNAIRSVIVPSTATLCPDQKASVSFDETENLLIEGDNLEVLKLLQKAYFEKVKMIYIDPPYNTGSDFVYKDDFKSPVKGYLEQTGQMNGEGQKLQTNKETNGRYHSDWLSMLYPRLKLAWNLLRSDGVIFVSIDDNEIHRLRIMMEEVFGEENFVAQISLLCNPKGRSQDKYFATNHEYILVFSKYPLPKGSFSIEKDAQQIENEYTEEDEVGKYRLLELRNTHREFGKHNRRNLYYPFYVNNETGEITLTKNDASVEVLPIWDDGFEGCWAWGKPKSELETEFLESKKVNGKWKIYRKSYANGADKMLKTIFIDKTFYTEKGQAAFNQLFEAKKKIFQSPKSVDLIKTLARTSTDSDDLVLDFFAGSGTTAQAVMELNQEDDGKRKYILVQIPEVTDEKSEAYKAGYKTIAEITKERVRRVGKKIEGASDKGFKIFKLGESNYPENTFDFDPEKSEEENQKAFNAYLSKAKQESLFADANSLDIVYENILKEGFSLNAKVEKRKLGKNNIYIATDGERILHICLDKKIETETTNELTGRAFKDRIFICLDKALDDTGKANLSLNLELKTI
ncbi:MAG: site-specific DNA-methyltransferase [Patescibacteria group bacterium]